MCGFFFQLIVFGVFFPNLFTHPQKKPLRASLSIANLISFNSSSLKKRAHSFLRSDLSRFLRAKKNKNKNHLTLIVLPKWWKFNVSHGLKCKPAIIGGLRYTNTASVEMIYVQTYTFMRKKTTTAPHTWTSPLNFNLEGLPCMCVLIYCSLNKEARVPF